MTLAALCRLDSVKNSVCEHIACSAKTFCIVHHLEKVREHYTQGATENFKRKVSTAGFAIPGMIALR